MTKDRRRDFLWNAAGSLTMALSSAFIAMASIRLLGEGEGGIFGFGYSTLGQQLFIMAYFGIRPFQVTDSGEKYSFKTYLSLRRITCLIGIFGAFIYNMIFFLLGSYSFLKAISLFLICMGRITEGYADVYESELQRKGLLYKTGQSLFLRTLISDTGFFLSAIFSKSLIISVIAFDLFEILGAYVFAVLPCSKCLKNAGQGNLSQGNEDQGNLSQGNLSQGNLSLKTHIGNFKTGSDCLSGLLCETVPLFPSVFLDFYIFSSSKYAVDMFLTNGESGFFNLLFMPASFIYVLTGFIIRPELTALSELYNNDYESFKKRVRKVLLITMLTGAVIFLMSLVLSYPGLYILEIILNAKGRLTGLKAVLITIVLGGALYALSSAIFYILIIKRRQKKMFVCYIFIALFSFIISALTVGKKGISGGAIGYVIEMLILLISFLFLAGGDKNG